MQQFQQVRAPFAGVITERGIERGDRVSGDGSDASAFLFKLARLNELRVIVDVPQSASLGLLAGAVAKLAFREFPGETFTATLRRRSGAIDAATGTMRVELALPNADLRLPAGLRGEATLDAGSQGGVRVLASAVQSRDGQSQVATVDAQNRLRFVPVKVDRTSGSDVIIRSGLTVGTRVVAGLSSLLREGALVSVLP
jgi:RND family efflux transporter MFP subunit